jgi:hypothetical protein
VSLRSRTTLAVTFFALVLALLLGSAGTASAAPYPVSTTAGATVDTPGGNAPLVAGAPYTFTLSGFGPFEVVTVVIFSDPINLGTFTADATGTVHVSVTLPAGLAPGSHTIVSTGASGKVVQFGLTLTAPAAAGSGQGGGGSDLAFTGVAIGGALVVALGLLAAGTITLMSGRRRAS